MPALSGSFVWMALGACLSIQLTGPPPPGSPFERLVRQFTGEEPAVLHYFDVRGRGEAIRLAMVDMGVAYEERSFTGEEWRGGLKAAWTAGGEVAFGQVPRLDIDGLHLVQSHSILRYLARRSGAYAGMGNDVLARIDVAADGTEDVRKQLTAIKYGDLSEEEKTAAFAAWFAEKQATWFGYFERLFTPGSHYVAGTPDPTHADYLIFDLIDTCASLGAPSTFLDAFPNVQNLRNALADRSKVSAYLATRRKA